jgi:hypothetical protein
MLSEEVSKLPKDKRGKIIFPEVFILKMKEMYESGEFSLKDIAEFFGVSRIVVTLRLKEMGVAFDKKSHIQSRKFKGREPANKGRKHPRIIGPVAERKCHECSVLKTADNFYKDSTCAGGIGYRCKECCKVRSSRDKEKIYRNHTKRYARHKSRLAEYNANWSRNNKAKVAAKASRRRAAKLRASTMWADHDKIEEFYKAADILGMLLGEWYHVDHIVPLQSKLVCGLHNEFNLQVIPASENQMKSNRWWPDMWEPLITLEENHV